MEKFKDLREKFHSELLRAVSSIDVEQIKIRFLGKKGYCQALIAILRESPAAERPALGKQINDLKQEITDLCYKALEFFLSIEHESQIHDEKIDITLPGRRRFSGHRHPLSLLLDDVLEIFLAAGFSVQYGPDIDSDWYNYEGLNFPPHHPAREMQDTFYIDSTMLLRSHTSNTQLRIMEKNQPPIRVVIPGTVFRNENVSARSHVFFHQVEGLYIDKKVSFADLLTTLEGFWQKLLQQEIEIRFRPSYFPFTTPSVEVDICCVKCKGRGCNLCKESGWLEVCGAGMVHPEVLRNGGIDPELYSGYAFGMGLERQAMLRYGINDIRLFSENDFRFLSQF
jgi:phenylalanyl-tRNA synthetase alpha chain